MFFRPKGSGLVIHDERGILSDWDIRTGQCLAELSGNSLPIESTTLTKDGKHLVTTSRRSESEVGEICVWDLETNRLLLRATQQGRYFGPWLSTDGMVLVATDDLATRAWALPSGGQLMEAPRSGIGRSLVLSDDGQLLVAFDRSEGRIQTWSVPDGRLQWELPTSVSLDDVELSPDAGCLAIRTTYGRVSLWNLTRSNEDAVFGEKGLTSCQFLGPNTLGCLCTGNRDLRPYVRLVEARSGQLISNRLFCWSNSIDLSFISHSGAVAVRVRPRLMSDKEGAVYLLAVPQAGEGRCRVGMEVWPSNGAFSSDGALMCACRRGAQGGTQVVIFATANQISAIRSANRDLHEIHEDLRRRQSEAEAQKMAMERTSRVMNDRITKGECRLCGRPLGFVDRIRRRQQHADCSSFHF